MHTYITRADWPCRCSGRRRCAGRRWRCGGGGGGSSAGCPAAWSRWSPAPDSSDDGWPPASSGHHSHSFCWHFPAPHSVTWRGFSKPFAFVLYYDRERVREREREWERRERERVCSLFWQAFPFLACASLQQHNMVWFNHTHIAWKLASCTLWTSTDPWYRNEWTFFIW